MAGNRAIDCREMKRMCDKLGPRETERQLIEALDGKHLSPQDFTVTEIAEAFMGREWVGNLRPKSGRYYSPRELQEADASAVAFSQFSNITGQWLFAEVKAAYENEEFVFSKVVPSKQTKIIGMEMIPSISVPSDEFTVVPEGGEYPFVGIVEDFQHRGRLQKRGDILPITKECILTDLTGLLLQHANTLGDALGLNREKRTIDMLIDENSGAVSAALAGHRYFWKNTSYASFQATTPWVNIQTGAALVDHTDIDAAWLRLVQMTNPYTGEPIRVQAKHLIVTPQNLMTAWRIKNTTNVQVHAGGYNTSGNLVDTHAPSPVNQVVGDLTILSSQLLAARAATDTDWWLGDCSKYGRYYFAWDVASEDAPANSTQAFNRDIVFQHKVSEMGIATVFDPRYLVENQA